MYRSVKQHRARRISLVAGISACAILAACSSSSSKTAVPVAAGSAGAGSAGSAAATAGGSTAAAGGGKITVGFSPLNQTIPAMIGVAKGAVGYGASKGIKVLVADPKSDPAKQVQQIEAWIANKQIQALWFISVNQGTMGQVLKKAQQAKVVVVADGAPENYGLSGPQPGVTFSRIDYTAFGNEAGTVLADCINSKLGGKSEVIYMTTSQGSGGLQEYQKAIETTLAAKAPNAKIVATVSDQIDQLKAQQAAASALQAHPGANALISIHDEGFLGGLNAFKQAGKKPSSDCLVGAGGSEPALAAVKAGDGFAEVALQFDADLAQTIDNLQAAAGNPTEVGKQLSVPIKTTLHSG